MTFASTINAIALVGVKESLLSTIKTFNIDPNNIRKNCLKKTKAILIVHLAGLFN